MPPPAPRPSAIRSPAPRTPQGPAPRTPKQQNPDNSNSRACPTPSACWRPQTFRRAGDRGSQGSGFAGFFLGGLAGFGARAAPAVQGQSFRLTPGPPSRTKLRARWRCRCTRPRSSCASSWCPPPRRGRLSFLHDRPSPWCRVFNCRCKGRKEGRREGRREERREEGRKGRREGTQLSPAPRAPAPAGVPPGRAA